MAGSPSRAVKLFGTEARPGETRLFRAGPLTMEFVAGNLRYIRYGGREAIRAISYVVRDRLWGTFNPEIRNLAIDESGDGFTVAYDAVCKDDSQEIGYSARIVGNADGSLRFEAVATPSGDFLTNRTGFVVLHPVDGVCGCPVEVQHVDGMVEKTTFPDIIDPKQPIMDIRALTHEVAPGVRVTCTMEGDTFEMEDQRNWTDASYKTYVRPLGLPFPYTLAAGVEISQAVELTFEGAPTSASASAASPPVSVDVGAAAGRMPRFAMALEARHAAAAVECADRLAPLTPAFLSCFFDARRDGAEAMQGFRAAGETFGVDLALEAVVPGERPAAEEVAAVARVADRAGAHFTSVAVSPAGDLEFVMPGTDWPDSRVFDALFAAARENFPGVPIGGGSFAYFTELNRKPAPFAALDFVCHTTCAIVHAADDRSVTETIECLPYIVKSGRALFGNKEYRVGPGGMATRTSPFGGEATPNPNNERVTMTRRDPRQRGLLGAAWHLGYAARMAEGGVDTVILGSPVGPFGLVHHAMDYAQPWYDDAGGVFPVFHVMRAMYAASGSERLATTSSVPRDVQVVAYRSNGTATLWLANLTGDEQAIAINEFGPEGVRVRVLDETTFESCAAGDIAVTERELSGSGLTLAPYAVAELRSSG